MLSTLQPPRSLSRASLSTCPPPLNLAVSPFLSSSSSSNTPPLADPFPQSSQILSIRRSLLSRYLTATQLAEAYLSRLSLIEPHINTFLHVSNNVLKQAQDIDNKIHKGEDVGHLAGVLVGVKDNIFTSDMPSTGGSRILENYRPPYDATAVKRLREEDAIVVGNTNLDEFGMGSTPEGSAFQVVPDFTFQFTSSNLAESRPSKGLRIGLIQETLDDGVDNGVTSAISDAASHLDELGCTVTEVKMRILMGTYALSGSAGFYDEY